MSYMIFKTVFKENEWGVPCESHDKWDYFYPQSSFDSAKQKVINNFRMFYRLWGQDKYLVIPSFNNGTTGKRMVTTITFNFFKRRTFSFMEFIEEWKEYGTRIPPDASITYEIVDLEYIFMME